MSKCLIELIIHLPKILLRQLRYGDKLITKEVRENLPGKRIKICQDFSFDINQMIFKSFFNVLRNINSIN